MVPKVVQKGVPKVVQKVVQKWSDDLRSIESIDSIDSIDPKSMIFRGFDP